MADLLIIVPSRSRPASLARVAEAWQTTGGFDHAELHFAVDADDPQHQAYRDAQDEIQAPVYLDIRPSWVPMVHKLNLVATLSAETHFAVGFAGDDHIPRTTTWAKRYLDELRSLGTGIVYGDDGHQGQKLPTQWAMTADIVRALGRMVPADVEHLFCDNAVMELGQAAGCLRYLPDIHIEHAHPYAGKANWDDQYRRVNSPDQYRRDRRAYLRWKRSGLAQDAATVRALREGAEAHA